MVWKKFLDNIERDILDLKKKVILLKNMVLFYSLHADCIPDQAVEVW